MAHKPIISVIGLGYVGLTTAVAFSQVFKVIAFDINPVRIDELKRQHDRNEEVGVAALTSDNLYFTYNCDDLADANFYIVAVPTPLNAIKHPDLTMLMGASQMLGKYLKKGDIVVYESTVYPGATEEECIPALESTSSLKFGKDFTVGFSPERINPADTEHVFQNIVKIVSGSDKPTLDKIAKLYTQVVKAGVFPVSSIRIAEATKVIENTQRDVNIALMNDIAIMLHTMGIDAAEVFVAMKTKWNHLSFEPGLVGGHCIGVNPYYLMHKSEQLGYYSDIISAARRVNEFISKYIVDTTIKKLIHLGVNIKGARIGVLGLTYKENCSDVRDTRVVDIINELESYEMQVLVHDPLADPATAEKEYGIHLVTWEALKNLDALMITVAHHQYRRLNKHAILSLLNSNGLIMDLKKIIYRKAFEDTDITIWRL